MPTVHQTMVEPSGPPTSFGPGTSDRISLQTCYPNSPIYNLTDQELREYFMRPPELNSEGMMRDGGYAFNAAPRFYQDSPNLEEVRTGGGGLPGTPYAPNIAPPTNGIDNPSSIPESGTTATIRSRGGGAWGVGNGLESPSNTRRRIVPIRMGQNILGSSRNSGE
jgi:hypothetical protein